MMPTRKPPRRETLRQKGDEWRRGNAGRALFNAFQAFERDLLLSLARDGFGEIRRVHLNLYRNLDFDGTRLTDLALRAGMTKQGMQELVDRAEQAGLVERRSDAADRRAKIVVFSDRGLELLQALHRGILFSERRMSGFIGADAVDQITTLLIRYSHDANGAVEPTKAGRDTATKAAASRSVE